MRNHIDLFAYIVYSMSYVALLCLAILGPFYVDVCMLRGGVAKCLCHC